MPKLLTPQPTWVKMLHKHTFFSYSRYGESESAALELVVDSCTFLDIYPKPVCQETEKD